MPLPTNQKAEAERPHGTKPWVWFWEIELVRFDGTNPPQVARVTNWHEQVEWPAGSGKIWYPFPIAQTQILQSTDGSLPGLDVTVSNVTRWGMPFLLSTRGLSGNRATCFLINSKAIGDAAQNSEFIQFDLQVAECSASSEAVTLRMTLPNFLELRTPSQRFVSATCRYHEFGSAQCGYIVNAIAAYHDCPRTYAACIARGLDEAVRNLPVLHPLRFGGFLGIPVERAA
ncbi:MAG: hypothetical protein EKK55_08725 [Rhodocyclaceae bacterium]|nr:MAG: hypothetical protein EKK55_08725 [Rhodocyclaceae bacterium]